MTHRVEASNASQTWNVCHIYPCVCPPRKIRVLKDHSFLHWPNAVTTSPLSPVDSHVNLSRRKTETSYTCYTFTKSLKDSFIALTWQKVCWGPNFYLFWSTTMIQTWSLVTVRKETRLEMTGKINNSSSGSRSAMNSGGNCCCMLATEPTFEACSPGENRPDE